MISVLDIPTNGFSLESVAQQYLGRGKLIRPDQDKVAEIERLFKDDRLGLAAYNIRDCELVTDLILELGLLDTLLKLGSLFGCTLSQILASSGALLTYVYRTLNNVGGIKLTDLKPGLAGDTPFKLKPCLGHHYDVVAIDFKFAIGQSAARFGIDVVSYGLAHIDPHSVPGHLTVSKTQTCYAELLKLIEAETDVEKRRQIRHCIFREIETSLLTPYSSGYHEETTRGAKAGANYTLRLFADICRQHGDRPILFWDGVLYISRSTESPKPVVSWLQTRDTELHTAILNKFPNAQSIELPLYGHYHHVYVGAKASWTAPNVPAIVIGEYKNQTLCVRGVNVSQPRTAYPPLFQVLLSDLFSTLFSGASPMDWARTTREKLFNGRLDHLLVFSKRIRKSPKRYGRQAPNHIVAARLARKFSGTIEYVISPNGPYPVKGPTRNIDYHFYDHQIIKPLLKLIIDDAKRDQIDASNPNQMQLF